MNNEEFNKTENETTSGAIYLNAPLTNQQNLQNGDEEITTLNTNTNSKDIKVKKIQKN